MNKPRLRVGVGTWAYQRVCSVRAGNTALRTQVQSEVITPEC